MGECLLNLRVMRKMSPQQVLTASHDGTAKVWSVASGKCLLTFSKVSQGVPGCSGVSGVTRKSRVTGVSGVFGVSGVVVAMAMPMATFREASLFC